MTGAMKHSVRGENLKRRRSLLAKSNWKVLMEEVALKLSFENRLPVQHIPTEVGQTVTLEKRERTQSHERNAGCLGKFQGTPLILEHRCVRRMSEG